MKERIIKALERAEILAVNDYHIHSWDIGDESSDFGLEFYYSDDEGIIFEFVFPWESLDKAVIKDNCLTMQDSEGESVDIWLYSLVGVEI